MLVGVAVGFSKFIQSDNMDEFVRGFRSLHPDSEFELTKIYNSHLIQTITF